MTRTAPRRPELPVRWLRVGVGAFGLAAVGLCGGAGPVADLALLAGALAALGTAWFPHTAAPWGVLVTALLPRLSGPGTVDAGVLAQGVALLLFQVFASLLALVAPARTVEVAVFRPALLRCGAVLLVVLPSALTSVLITGSGNAVPGTVAAGLAAGAAALLTLVAGRARHDGV